MSAQDIPAGFTPLPLDGSFNDAFAPVYLRWQDEGVTIALQVGEKHLNAMGICHGAVYMALFDIAFAAAVGHKLGKFVGTPTININIDYMAASKPGEWLFVEPECPKLTSTMGFTKGMISSDSGDKAMATGIFKLPPDVENAPGISAADLNRS
jgi:uncharacterized protein (TIGR00369 family)